MWVGAGVWLIVMWLGLGCGYSNVGWGIEVGVVDSKVGKRWRVRVMFDELVEMCEAKERGTAGVSED